MLKQIKTFLFDLMQTYPPLGGRNKEQIINDTADYILENLEGKNVDFEKAKNLFFEKYERKTFPTPIELMKYLNKAVIIKDNPELYDGSWYLLTLPNKRIYSFVLSPSGKTIEEYKEEWQRKYKGFTLKKYDKDCVLIGDKVYAYKDGKLREI